MKRDSWGKNIDIHDSKKHDYLSEADDRVQASRGIQPGLVAMPEPYQKGIFSSRYMEAVMKRKGENS
jgi:hypothetical protein